MSRETDQVLCHSRREVGDVIQRCAPQIRVAADTVGETHQGILRQSRVYSMLAQAEIAIALHVGFLGIPSYLPKEQVVWAVLGLWAALLALRPWIARLDSGWEMAQHAGIFAALTLYPGHALSRTCSATTRSPASARARSISTMPTSFT